MFPIPLWNVHNGAILGQDLTNNAHKGWQRRFVSQVTCHHPTLWKFINCLKAELRKAQNNAVSNCLQVISHQEGRKNMKGCDRRLRRLVHTFEDRTPVEFLPGVAHNLAFNVVE